MVSNVAVSEGTPRGEHILFAAPGPARLSSILYAPEKPTKSAVILIPQGAGGLSEGDHDYNPLAQKLMDAGYALLLTNMRTANGGWFYTLFETSKDDIAGAIKLMKDRGYTDIILLGTEEQVRLAERAARELVAGRRVHTDELVVSLRDFIRAALDLDRIPADLEIPKQGPTRQASAGGRNKGEQGSRGGGGQGAGLGAEMGFGGGADSSDHSPSGRS